MHASPALVVWALRWTRASSELAASAVPAEAAKFSHATFAELVGCTMTMYSVWAVLYYFKVGRRASAARSLQPSQIDCDILPQRLISTFWGALQVFVISASKIREENYETLYSLMTKNKNGMVAKIVFSVPKPFQVGHWQWLPICEQSYAACLPARLMLTAHGFLICSRSCTCYSISCYLPPPRQRPTSAGTASTTTPPSSCSCFWALHGMVRFAYVLATMTAKIAEYTLVAYNGCHMKLRACCLSACVAWYREQLLLPALCIQIREEDGA